MRRDRDQGVKILIGELVLNGGDGAAKNLADLGEKVGEGGGSPEGYDASEAACVAESAVAGAREDLAAEAEEELHPLRIGGHWRREGARVLGGGEILGEF